MNGLLHAHCDLPQLRRELSSQLEEVDAQISATIDVTEFRRVAGDLSRHEDGLDSLCESLAGYEVSCRDLAGSLSWVLAQTKAKLDAKALVHQQRERLQLQLRIEQTRVRLEQLLDGASSAAGAHRPPEGWAAEGTRRTGTAAGSDEVLRAAREMGRLRLLRQRGAEEQLRAVHLGTEQWERLQTRLLSRLTTALREALEARDEARVAQAVVGFVDAGSAAEAEQWIRLEWVAPRLGPRLQHAARGGERDAFARVCAEVVAFARGPDFASLLAPAVAGLRPPLHLLSSTVWLETNRILKTMPGVFGALAGVPSAFHTAYAAAGRVQVKQLPTQTAHLGVEAELEALLPAASERQYLRSHPATTDLIKRFNLPIYFQLRLQELAKALDASLPPQGAALELLSTKLPTDATHADDEPSSERLPPPAGLLTVAARTVVQVVTRCFAPDVYIMPLCSRFFRLALQLLLRFDSWANVRSKAPVDVGSSAQPPTPSDSRGSAAVDVPAATVVPRRNELSFLFLDCDTVTAWVRQTLQPSLEDVLGLRDAKPDLKGACADALRETGDVLAASSAGMRANILSQLVGQCVAQLAPARAIPALYCMTGRAVPTAPSLFVPELLRPLRTFLADCGVRLSVDDRHAWARDAGGALAKQYLHLATGMLDTVRNNEAAIRKYGAKKAAGAVDAPPAASDSDKVCVQLFLDVQAFGDQLRAVGVDAALLAEYGPLADAVRPSQALIESIRASGGSP